MAVPNGIPFTALAGVPPWTAEHQLGQMFEGVYRRTLHATLGLTDHEP